MNRAAIMACVHVPWDRTRKICAAGLVSVLALSGGCTAPDYGATVTRFAEATTQATSTLDELSKIADEKYTESVDARILKTQGAKILPTEGECDLNANRCRLEVVATDKSLNRHPYPPKPLLRNTQAMMRKIQLYVKSLASVVNEDTVAKVQGNATAALGHVQGLAKATGFVEKEKKQSESTFFQPLGALTNWLVGKYIEREKVKALRSITREADPVIQEAGTMLSKVQVLNSDIQRRILADEVNDAIEKANKNIVDLDKRANAVAAAKKFDVFLRAKLTTSLAQMAKAHSALTKALNNSEGFTPATFSEVEAFANEVFDFAKLLQGFQTSTAKSEGDN